VGKQKKSKRTIFSDASVSMACALFFAVPKEAGDIEHKNKLKTPAIE